MGTLVTIGFGAAGGVVLGYFTLLLRASKASTTRKFGAGPYRAQEYVQQAPSVLCSIDRWIGLRGPQRQFRWIAAVMFGALAVYAVDWFMSGSTPDKLAVLSASSEAVFTVKVPDLVGGWFMSGLSQVGELIFAANVAVLGFRTPEVVDVALMPLWVLALMPAIRSVITHGVMKRKGVDRSRRQHEVMKGIMMASSLFIGLTFILVNTMFFKVTATQTVALVALFAFIAGIALTVWSVHRAGSEKVRAVTREATSILPRWAVPISASLCLPFGFLHGFVYVTVLALLIWWGIICFGALVLMFAFVATWIFELIRRWVGRLLRAVAFVGSKFWYYLNAHDIPEEPDGDGEPA